MCLRLNTVHSIVLWVFITCSFNSAFASSSIELSIIQVDSLLKEKNIKNDMTQLELLVLYQDALLRKPIDSIDIFKKLALLNADLEQPKDAFIYTEKYIANTLDLSILNNSEYEFIFDSSEYKLLSNRYLGKYSTLDFLYLYTALIGFFFMIIINFKKKANRYSNFFIGTFVGVHSLFIMAFVLYVSNLRLKFPHTFFMASATALLYGPLIYFYFKSVFGKYTFKVIDLIHLVPTIVLLIVLYPIVIKSSSEKLAMMLDLDKSYKFYVILIYILKAISLIFYALLIWEFQFKRIKKIYYQNKNMLVFTWVKILFRMHLIYIVSYLIYAFSVLEIIGKYSIYISHGMVIIMSFMVVYISYIAYVQPNVFNKEYVLTTNGFFFEKYKKSGLTKGLSKELKENLILLLEKDKVFKQNNISLEILAKNLNTTRHNASQIINEHFDMNFFELINKFRIKEAVNIFQEDTHENLNIIDVAYEVGYNNKVTFNKAFKKETSLTPSQYIKSCDNNESRVKLK